MTRTALPPFVLLVGFGLAFALAALGGGLPVFDDHPGQFYRLWHGLAHGLLPWEWNAGWWGGYPELQFYPPGYVYLGAIIYYGAFGALSPAAVYRVLLWIIYFLPGVATFWLLARLLPNPWLALPAALVALTLSGGMRSGVEEGLRWGLIAARLGWGLLPLLALSLVGWQEQTRRWPLWAAPLLAAVVLTHPAHAPAAVALVLLAGVFGEGSRQRRLGQAVWVLVVGLALTGVWALPLLAHLHFALPLAWGEFTFASLGSNVLGRPLLLFLVAAYVMGWVAAARTATLGPPALALLAWTPALLAILMLDSLVVEQLGFHWLPADRLLDSVLLALVLGAGMATALLRPLPSGVLLITIAVLGQGALGSGEPTLSLWPRAQAWPRLAETARGLRLEQLWTRLRAAPPGRILFVRSAVPLAFGHEWWRPHTHITALTPILAGREIINGTFTHPSPVAGLIYRGSAEHRPIRHLVERLDGDTLFGKPLEALTPEAFDPLASRLRISTVVALEEDRGRLPFVEANPLFHPPDQIGPFLIYAAREGRRMPEAVSRRRWRATLGEGHDGWAPAGIAYYPLWRAVTPSEPLAVRADALGMLEVKLPPGRTGQVDLVYGEGLWEWLGIVLSSLGLIVWGGTAKLSAATRARSCARSAPYPSRPRSGP